MIIQHVIITSTFTSTISDIKLHLEIDGNDRLDIILAIL